MNQLRVIPRLIFTSRWLQVPLYLGLIVAQAIYALYFIQEIWDLFAGGFHLDETKIMLAILGLIDVVLISNLLIMVIIGGYETFVSRLGLEGHPDEPEWLDHLGSGTLKVKLAMALVSISSIHLLKTFIDAQNQSSTTIMWQVFIHLTLVLSALATAGIDKISQPAVNNSQ